MEIKEVIQLLLLVPLVSVMFGYFKTYGEIKAVEINTPKFDMDMIDKAIDELEKSLKGRKKNGK